MNQDHLSAAEVAMFREDSFSSRSIEIGRHLLACKECRAKLPSVTPQEFRHCLLGAGGARLDESEHKSRFFNLPVLSFARVTAFASFAILLLAGIYFVGVQKSITSMPAVARIENNPATSDLNSVPDALANPTTREKNQLPTKSVNVANTDSRPQPPLPKTDQRKVKIVAAGQPTVQNAETRGSDNPCSGGATINLESKSDGKELFLKWNSVKGVESYEVYISDLDENLVDHFESKSQTHYRSTVRLDPAKSYRWKLIITLKNGNKIVGPPQVLTSNTSTEESKKSGATEKPRGSFELRCVESK